MSSTTTNPVYNRQLPGDRFAGDQLAGTWGPRLLSVLRIVTALLFMSHGIQKLFGFPAPPSFGMPAAFTLVWVSAVLELVGGALMLVGFLTRPVAFLLSGEMAVAYWTVHAPHSPFPVINGGELAIVYCFVFLYFAAAGGGPWSLDQARRGSSLSGQQGF